MNREIRRLRITIEPHRMDSHTDRIRDLRIEVFVNNQVHTVTQSMRDDDFESFFDYIMDDAKLRLRRAVMSYKPHEGVVTDAA